jgi:mRNA-degrading endonuclease RelE of RelBE toxin-antitoxin system
VISNKLKMFNFDISDKLKLRIRKLLKKDNKKVVIINKKIREIINNDFKTIDRYKNLKYHLKHLKRVHIDKHFVLTFQVFPKKNYILFTDFDHHDNVYKK